MTTTSEFAALVKQLVEQGFVSRRGRPQQREKPLGPELQRRLKLSPRRVRQLLATIRQPRGMPPSQRSNAAKAVRLSLQHALGTKVDVIDDGGVGRIVVHFAGYEHLDDLIAKMTK